MFLPPASALASFLTATVTIFSLSLRAVAALSLEGRMRPGKENPTLSQIFTVPKVWQNVVKLHLTGPSYPRSSLTPAAHRAGLL